MLLFIHTPMKAEYYIPYVTNEISNQLGKKACLTKHSDGSRKILLGNFQLKIHFEMNIFIECNIFIHLYRENYMALKIMPKCTEKFMTIKYDIIALT